jgi:hypothetical protein
MKISFIYCIASGIWPVLAREPAKSLAAKHTKPFHAEVWQFVILRQGMDKALPKAGLNGNTHRIFDIMHPRSSQPVAQMLRITRIYRARIRAIRGKRL